ncbi:hypothetical protein J1N35_037037 [Gossypium stocksii]|uniref:Uncharacterized protein n=1 Tax=Gossypium stocksii TaxID=47602 RepID=A0A9D3UJD1_9ROSI|nr:hypothetical protein J1N35_037037 [Gossypium stocksii]
MEQWFNAKGIIDDTTKKEASFSSMDRLKPWAKLKLQCQGIKELTKDTTVAKSLIKLVLRKDKFESSKSKEKGMVEEMKNDKLRKIMTIMVIENYVMGSRSPTTNQKSK